MSTFKFTQEYFDYEGVPESTRTVEFKAEVLSDILEQFELFLRGCGFVFDGTLDIVVDETDDDTVSFKEVIEELED